MSIEDFGDIFTIIGDEQLMSWIEVNAGSLQNRDYVRPAESTAIDFYGWLAPTPAKIQLRETGTVTHKRYTLRFDPRQNSQLESIKIKDIIEFNGRRYFIDQIYPFQHETNIRHYSVMEADT